MKWIYSYLPETHSFSLLSQYLFICGEFIAISSCEYEMVCQWIPIRHASPYLPQPHPLRLKLTSPHGDSSSVEEKCLLIAILNAAFLSIFLTSTSKLLHVSEAIWPGSQEAIALWFVKFQYRSVRTACCLVPGLLTVLTRLVGLNLNLNIILKGLKGSRLPIPRYSKLCNVLIFLIVIFLTRHGFPFPQILFIFVTLVLLMQCNYCFDFY